MKVIIQVVKEASVIVDKKLISKISNGYLLLVGLENGDNEETCKKVASKIINLRINKDENGKTNLSLKDVSGRILSISQFTLAANIESRRPSFTNALEKNEALRLYKYFDLLLVNEGIEVLEGVFGAHMEVNLINDGPFTIIVDSSNI